MLLGAGVEYICIIVVCEGWSWRSGTGVGGVRLLGLKPVLSRRWMHGGLLLQELRLGVHGGSEGRRIASRRCGRVGEMCEAGVGDVVTRYGVIGMYAKTTWSP